MGKAQINSSTGLHYPFPIQPNTPRNNTRQGGRRESEQIHRGGSGTALLLQQERRMEARA